MRALAASLLASLILSVPAIAATYVVDPYGTGDYPTIQAAVNGSASGDVIELTDGTFTGPGNRDIRFNGKDLTVRSQSGDPTRTVIDCELAEQAFLIWEGEEVHFQGMTMTRGRDSSWGGAVCVEMAAHGVFRDCIFSDNSAPGNAGAVMIMNCGHAEFEGCTFIDNSSYAGGAVCT
ncbi:MAG: hypothetical protein QUU85_04875 [Candidatus Eisenbacteria bacterium]|nr:hypothetical protein [Candidatus Eisenbacteria bacterium]